MFDIGIQEMFVIMVLALIVFGPDKLPELGRRLGRAMREFRRASDEFRRTVETNLHLDEDHSALPPSAAFETPSAVAATGADAGHDGVVPAGEPAASEPAAAPVDGHPDDSILPVGEMAEPFWTTRGGRLLHRASCSWRTRVPGSDRLPLKAATDGWDMGLVACPACDPQAAPVVS